MQVIEHLVLASCWIPGARLVGIWEVKQLHVFIIEFEVIDIGVLIDALRSDAFRQRNIALENVSQDPNINSSFYLLQAPSQQNLRPCLSVLLANLLKYWFVAS